MIEKNKNNNLNFGICPKCKGRGKKNRRIQKKVRLQYQIALKEFQKKEKVLAAPIAPKSQLYVCSNCAGSGLISSINPTVVDTKNYPNIAIIGGGIGGVALAVACLHRGIPFTLYERDCSFDARSQGYGLTLQQASKAIQAFGITSLKEGVVSTKHIVHSTDGKIIGEWGMRKWMQTNAKKSPKRTNIHIARQSLRLALLEQLNGHSKVQWGHQFIKYKEGKDVDLTFKVNGQLKKVKADLVVGADGIRSSVRKQLINKDPSKLRYLNCMVILGICPLKNLKNIESPLLDSATVFQTANGNERIYVMPYTSDSIMWQLSFPISEKDAKILSSKGSKALKKEACLRTQWHTPIPQIVATSSETLISGYPVYDRKLLQPELLQKNKFITLIGDAAHPMSPFKGQGANQALLDALSLAREITKECRPLSNWQITGIRKSVLNTFELEMLKRSSVKVSDSAEAVKFLHSEIILQKRNQPRGPILD